MRRERKGWSYLGVLSMNPKTDRSAHPLARIVTDAYERTGRPRDALHALCVALHPDD